MPMAVAINVGINVAVMLAEVAGARYPPSVKKLSYRVLPRPGSSMTLTIKGDKEYG